MAISVYHLFPLIKLYILFSFQVIDIWMFVSNFYPFIIIICQTYIHNIKDNPEGKDDKIEVFRKNNKEKENGDMSFLGSNAILIMLERFCKFYLPVLGVCFVCGYWTFGYFV